jgi:predicted phage terminase large subunit-like protein
MVAPTTTTITFRGFRHEREEGALLHPARDRMEEVERLRKELGSHAFAAQYQQAPVAESGRHVKRAWFRRYREAPTACTRIIHSWDTAFKDGASHDASVCTIWGEGADGFFLLEVVSIRASYPDLVYSLMTLVDRFPPDAVLIEDKGSGQVLIQELRKQGRIPVIAIQPKYDKLTRLLAVTPLIEAGRVWLPEDASWLPAFEEELFAFPHAAHDDQVDAFTQYLHWARDRSGTETRIRTV